MWRALSAPLPQDAFLVGLTSIHRREPWKHGDRAFRAATTISITDDAAEILRNALQKQPAMAVHLSIDSAWNHNFSLGPASGQEIVASDMESRSASTSGVARRQTASRSAFLTRSRVAHSTLTT
ncbi:MAG: hypothetical protein ACI9W2_000806 [Gammaproteobacteria bacterium]|jgi:hypothetical protein